MSRQPPFRRLRLVLLFAAAAALGAAGGADGQDAAPGESVLHYTNWTATAYSRHAGGTACWISGADGSLRVELRRGPAGFTGDAPAAEGNHGRDLQPLLERTGEGWTMVLGPDDTGTLNAWDREWREPPAGLVQMVRLVTGALAAHPGPRPDFAFCEPFPAKQDPGPIPRPRWAAQGPQASKDAGFWRYLRDHSGLEVDQIERLRGAHWRMISLEAWRTWPFRAS